MTRLLPRFLSFLCLNVALCWGGACDLAEIAGDIDRGSLSAAEAKLKAVEATGQRCDELLLQTGRLKFAQADFTGAEDLFSRFVNAAPKDARGYYQIALVALVKGDYPRADNFSSLALSYQAEYAEALVLHGRLLAMKGQTAEALAALQRACALNPQDAEAHFQLGALFDRQKRYAEAVAQFERVVAINPPDARAWDYLGLNLEPIGQIERAEAAFRKGLEMNQGRWADKFLDYNYGRFLCKQGRLEESRKHLDRALDLTPSVRAVHYEHAKLSLRMRNLALARREAEKALELPDRAGVILELQVYYLLQQIYSQIGESALARKYAELSRTTPIPPRGR
jgi:tetratricopeptide (TPR) repeat protein